MTYRRHAPSSYRHLAIVLSALMAACFSPACQSAPGSPAPPVTADTWAVVDGRQITRADVEKTHARKSNSTQTLSEEEVLTAKLALLNDLIVQDILLAKARELKVELQDKDLDATYEEAKKNIPDDAFQQELKRRGLSVADMREGLRRDLLAEKVIEREIGSKIAITDQQVTDFFSANRSQFNVPEEAYHVAQIVVTPVSEGEPANATRDDATTPQAALEKLKMLTDRLKGGASFAELAASYSEEPETAARGGDLGFIPVSRLKQAPEGLREAVLNKPPGTINVVSSAGAHAIVLVVAHEQAGQRELSTPGVRDRITETLRGRREQLLRAAYLTALRSDANVTNYQARRIVEGQGR
jgi:peptidyl-prolyl cis-trans isomerase SurA